MFSFQRDSALVLIIEYLSSPTSERDKVKIYSGNRTSFKKITFTVNIGNVRHLQLYAIHRFEMKTRYWPFIIFQFIRSATDNVLDVIMFTTFSQLKMTDFNISMEVEEAFLARVPRGDANSQFAIVEYENHKAAAVARRVLIPKYGHVLAIDWAVPPKERKRNIHVSLKEKNKK